MKLYKLTDQNKKTHETMSWGIGVTNNVIPKKNPLLCTRDVIHAYTNLNLGYLLNPMHAAYENPLAWESEGEVVVMDWGKVGCFNLTTKEILNQPKWVGSQKEMAVRILFAILCAESVLQIFEKFSDDKRPYMAIQAARKYLTTAAAHADAHAAAYAAADAAAAVHAATHATDAAAYAAAYAAEIDFGKIADMAVITIMEGK